MPRTPRNPQSRESLIDRGLELILRQGYHGTGISEIVGAAGVPKGSFYNHFESKEAFVAELIERYGDGLRSTLLGLIEEFPDDPLEALTRAYELAAHYHQENQFQGCLIANLSGELATDEQACLVAMRAQMAAWTDEVSALLERGQQAGTVRDDLPAAELAEFFWDTWEGALLRAKTEHSIAPLERALRMLRALLGPRR